MPILIEALSVVVRRETIDRRYEGGWSGFVADTMNDTLCADSNIARIGFMHPNDVSAFIRRLERHGFVFLDGAGSAMDVVVVDQREGPTTPCTWIEFFRQTVPGGVVSAARLAGSREEGLFCPDGWDFEHSLSRSFQFYPNAEKNENLEFVRQEHAISVFRDRRTGQEVYLTRPTTLGGDEQHSYADDDYEALWSEASDLLAPYAASDHRPETADEIAKVARAKQALEMITALPDVNFPPWWLLGIARRLLSDREGAYAAFARAYGMAPDEIEVARHFAMECIALGYGQEAIAVTTKMTKLTPGDAGILANHALALLIAGDVDGAFREVGRALQMNPDDEITQHLRELIDNVRAGRVERPSRIKT